MRFFLPNVSMSQYACNTMPRFIVESQNLPLVACGSLALISLQDSAARSLTDPSGTVVSIKTNCCYPFVLDLVCIAGLLTVHFGSWGQSFCHMIFRHEPFLTWKILACCLFANSCFDWLVYVSEISCCILLLSWFFSTFPLLGIISFARTALCIFASIPRSSSLLAVGKNSYKLNWSLYTWSFLLKYLIEQKFQTRGYLCWCLLCNNICLDQQRNP